MQSTLTVAAIFLTVIAYAPYIQNTLNGETKPHAFSWLIFSIVTGIAFIAQISRGGGIGSLLTGFSALVCFIVFILALTKGTRHFDRVDWILLIGSLFSIILWVITSEPLISVLIVCIIEVVAFIPALRKGYNKPFEETLFTYIINIIRFTLGIISLNTFSAVTVLFPATVLFVNIIFVSTLAYKRKTISV